MLWEMTGLRFGLENVAEVLLFLFFVFVFLILLSDNHFTKLQSMVFILFYYFIEFM